MVCLFRPYPFKFFKGCLPQTLFGLFLNTLSQIRYDCTKSKTAAILIFQKHLFLFQQDFKLQCKTFYFTICRAMKNDMSFFIALHIVK